MKSKIFRDIGRNNARTSSYSFTNLDFRCLRFRFTVFCAEMLRKSLPPSEPWCHMGESMVNKQKCLSEVKILPCVAVSPEGYKALLATPCPYHAIIQRPLPCRRCPALSCRGGEDSSMQSYLLLQRGFYKDSLWWCQGTYDLRWMYCEWRKLFQRTFFVWHVPRHIWFLQLALCSLNRIKFLYFLFSKFELSIKSKLRKTKSITT